MYVSTNFKTKKEFLQSVKDGKKHYPYNPSGMFAPKTNGTDVIEGPHYPEAHRWYAQVVIKEGVIISAK